MNYFKKIGSVIKRNSPKNNGFTLLEVIIAMAIFAIGILGVANMQLSSSNSNTSARKHTEASSACQGEIERVMGTLFTNLPVNGVANSLDGYPIVWSVLRQDDYNGDGNFDMWIMQATATDASGIPHTYIFARTRNSF